jgi:hypothetical protein
MLAVVILVEAGAPALLLSAAPVWGVAEFVILARGESPDAAGSTTPLRSPSWSL